MLADNDARSQHAFHRYGERTSYTPLSGGSFASTMAGWIYRNSTPPSFQWFCRTRNSG
jgi:hypothetical protein